MNALIPTFGIIGGILSLAAYPPYLIDMVKGKTKPERATWLIWFTLSSIALAAQLSAHATWSLYMTIAQVLGTGLVVLGSYKYGYAGWKRRDIISIVIAGLGLLLWAITDKPVLAIVFVIVVDAAGTWLTVYKAYKVPATETISTWWIDACSNFFAVLAVGSLNYTLLAYPAYLFVANSAIVIAMYAGRAAIKNRA